MPEADLTITISGKDQNVAALLDKIQKGLERLEKGAKDMSGEVARSTKTAEAGFTRMANNMRSASEKVSMTLGKLSSISGQVLGVLGVGGLTGVIYKSISAFTALDDSMKEVSTLISGDAREAIAGFTADIKKLSAESGKSTVELSKGLYQIISAGTKGTEDAAGAMELLNVAQKAATAGVSSTFSAVDALTTALNSYNLTTKDASKFSDIMFTTVRLGKTTFNELAAKIGTVAATASNANIGFGELNAAVAQLTKGGLSTDIAMTSLNALIISMLKPTKEMEAAVQKLGKGYKSVGDMLSKEGLAGALKLLNDLTGGNAEAMQKLTGSVEANRAAGILAGKGYSEFEKILSQFKDTTGATEEAYAKMTESFTFKLQKFRAKLELMFLEVGEKLMPSVLGMLDDLSAWFDANSGKIVGYVQEFADAAIGMLRWLVANADTIIKVMAAIWVTEKVASFSKSIWDLADAFIKLKGAVAAIGAGNIGKILLALGGGSAALGAAGAAAVIGGTIYAAGNLSDPDLIKPEEGGTPGVPGLAGYTAGMNAPEWAKALSGGDIADMIAENAKVAAKETSKEIEKEQDKASDNKRKRTEKEIAAEKKLREELEKDVAELAAANLDKRAQLEQKHFKERESWEKREGLTKEQRENALHELQLKQDAELAALDEEERKATEKADKEEHDRKVELMEYVQQSSAQALENYKEMRAEASIAAQKRADAAEKAALEAQKAQEEADKKDWTKLAFWKEVGKGFANKMGAELFEWGMKVADVITTPLSAIFDLFGNLFGGFKTVGAAPFQKIGEIFGSILGGSDLASVKAATQQAALFFEQLSRRLPAALEWFASTGVPTIINSFVDSLPAVISALVEGIPLILDAVISNLDKIILPFVEGMLTLIPKLIDELPLLVSKVAELLGPAIAAIFKNLPNILASAVKGVVEGIGGLVTGLVRGIADIFTDKSKAQKARERQDEVMKSALGMGYTESEAQQLASEAYESEMGRGYNSEAYARFMYDKVYYDTLAGKGVDWKTLYAIRNMSAAEQRAYLEPLARERAKKEYDRIMGAQATARGSADLSTMHPGHDESGMAVTPSRPSDVLDKMHSGGYVEAAGRFARAIRAHSGYSVPAGLALDEVPIIAQAGEAVMNRRWVQSAGGKQAIDEMNRSGSAGRVVNNVYVEHMMSGDTAEVVDRLISGNLRAGAGRLYERLSAGAPEGYRTRRS